VQDFIDEYPGTVTPAGAQRDASLPIWVAVTHVFNLLFMIFIVRSGLQILSDHPRLYWTRHSTPGRDWFRIQKPVPADPRRRRSADDRLDRAAALLARLRTCCT